MQTDISVFDYDKELFLSLDKQTKSSFIKNYIASILNDNNLIVKYVSKMKILQEKKGGWVYCQRSVFDIKYECVKPNTIFTFQNKGNNKGDTYAIMILENCNKLRDLMIKLVTYCNHNYDYNTFTIYLQYIYII